MFKNQTIFYPKTTNPTPSYYPLLHSSNSPLPMLFHSTYALPTQTIPSSFPTSYPTLLHSITPCLSYPPELHQIHLYPTLYPPYLHPTLLNSSPFKKPYPLSNSPSFLHSIQPLPFLLAATKPSIINPSPILNPILSSIYSYPLLSVTIISTLHPS